MDPFELRFIVYRHFVDTGTALSRHTLADIVGDLDTVDGLLRELHDRHMLVLDNRSHRSGDIRMALPFAAEPTNFRVTTNHGAWWANCAWDSLAILAALDTDGRIESTSSDTGEPVHLTITDGRVDSNDGRIQSTSISPFLPANGGTTSCSLEAPSPSFGRRTINSPPETSSPSLRCGPYRNTGMAIASISRSPRRRSTPCNSS